MLVSDKLIEIVGNKSLKGFTISKDGRVVPVCKLYSEDIISLKEYIDHLCEFIPGNDYTSLIDKAVRLQSRPITNLLVADIPYGSLLNLTFDNKYAVSLVYLGNCRFCVCEDATFNLLPMDVLQCLNLKWSIGRELYFRVYREKSPYPDDSKLFYSKLVGISISHSYIRNNEREDIKKEIKKSLLKVYAWNFKENPLRFTSDELTDNDSAPIILDVSSQRFWIDQYKPQFSNICDVRKKGDGFSVIEQGHFYLSKNQVCELYIDKKVIVGL